MIFTEAALAGAFLIDMERIEDDRGFFARSFCAEEFAGHGLAANMPQCSVSFNSRRATLRGLHYQSDPHAEEKLVRCTAGAVFDVIVDLRAGSRTRVDGWESSSRPAIGARFGCRRVSPTGSSPWPTAARSCT